MCSRRWPSSSVRRCHGDASPIGHNSGNILLGHVPVFLTALAALIPLGLQLFLIVFFRIPQLGGLLKVLRGMAASLSAARALSFSFKAHELFRRLFLLHLYTAGSLVHQVDGFVRQEPVIDIPGREFHRSLQCFIGDVQAVVLLILPPQALSKYPV